MLIAFMRPKTYNRELKAQFYKEADYGIARAFALPWLVLCIAYFIQLVIY